MQLLFVADGERDRCVVSKLVERVLNTQIEARFKPWKDFSGHPTKAQGAVGKGYERKLKLALLTARNLGLSGLVATLDSDRAPKGERLRQLITARDADRKNQNVGTLPTAVGEAVPHLEAWLLDDPKAVKHVLGLPAERELANVRDVDPKSTLNELCAESSHVESFLDLLSEIAANHDCERCNHRAETGLHEFVEDVRRELGPLVVA
ncbi:MAG: hypothetical protein SH868_14715 [Bythopirellula sp.]|nr:hypothetical protein [Bythopirellula sp.]